MVSAVTCRATSGRSDLLDDDLVETIAELLGEVQGVLVGAGESMDGVEPTGKSTELAQSAEHMPSNIATCAPDPVVPRAR